MNVFHKIRGLMTPKPQALESEQFTPVRLSSSADYAQVRSSHAETFKERAALEHQLIREDEEAFTVDGECFLCGKAAAFEVTFEYAYEVDGRLTPNWREGLRCPVCGLNNRMRAALHLLDTLCKPTSKSKIYITEQLGPIYDRLTRTFESVVGSEYLRDGTAPGDVNSQGVRHEDLTRLTFGDGELDLVISFDVLEHVPNFRAALGEIRRVLRPGGQLMLSAPFRAEMSKNLTRAVLRDDGSVEHLTEPEYHGDPLSDAGCLAFYHFGWELLDDLCATGFTAPAAHLYWSRRYGYLGRDQLILTAEVPR